jgi:hypothetical protein
VPGASDLAAEDMKLLSSLIRGIFIESTSLRSYMYFGFDMAHCPTLCPSLQPNLAQGVTVATSVGRKDTPAPWIVMLTYSLGEEETEDTYSSSITISSVEATTLIIHLCYV